MSGELMLRVALVGAGATAFVDLWALARRSFFRQPLPDWALVGRWFAWLPRGRWRHDPISSTPRVAGEALIGWSAHYATGIGFAGVLALLAGGWLDHPTPGPALALGLATVAAPFLILQPGMGAGFAGRRTRRPAALRVQSLVTHGVFGAGLYVSAVWLASG